MDEETKQRLLEELRKEYKVELKPLKEAPFSVKDIFEKYNKSMCEKIGADDDWRTHEQIDNAIRKVMCLHYGVGTVKYIPVAKREQFRKDLEKFIKEFILMEE